MEASANAIKKIKTEVEHNYLRKLKNTQDEMLKFNFPVERQRPSKAMIVEPQKFTSKINNNLLKMAGQLAYSELQQRVP